MRTKKIKQTEILFLSFLISLLQNSPRLLELIGFLKYTESSYISPPTSIDVIFRMSFLFLYSYAVLLYNTNLDSYFKKFGKPVFLLTSVLINGFILYVFTSFYFEGYDDFTGYNLYIRDQKLLLFILVIVMLGLIALAKNLLYKIQIQEDIEEKQRLLKQNLQNELAALKNQINPHFLFNSLNSLNSLIKENNEATTFVNQLSYMYRYILQSGNRDLVSIKEELKFIDSYVFLINSRYRDKFSIDMTVDDSIHHIMIPVLALQLLVENAVKHNEISNKNRLKVKVFNTKEFLIVENRIKLRSTFVDSTGQGLANINKRYILLTGKSILISNENDIFSVKMPIN